MVKKSSVVIVMTAIMFLYGIAFADLQVSSGKNVFLPAGEIVEGVLVTGALVSTGSPNTYKAPIVIIRLINSIKTFPFEVFLLAQAHPEGILNPKRVVIEAYKIVMIRDGKVVEKIVNGQIQGEDGIDGVPGKVINSWEFDRMLKFLGATVGNVLFTHLARDQQHTKNTSVYLRETKAMWKMWYTEKSFSSSFIVVVPGQKVYWKPVRTL